MIKIFNTLTKRKEELRPINPKQIMLYVCGITVYDICHLGHGRTFVIFDTIVRYLNYRGYKVVYVRNITDIDDKIIYQANKNNESINQLTNRMIQDMYLDLDALNILRPNYEPRVTEYINDIIEFIELLLKKKCAYLAVNGDVMFSVQTMHNYGILSNRKIVKIFTKKNFFDSIKRNSMDFVLWKSSKLGEPYWMSPWGKGRPGWHIECSAMSYTILGKHFDIHGGGSDLIFPHHDNEIAQSTCAHGTPYVNIWMHTGILLFNNVKMSKSLNNFLTIRDIIKQYDSETVRYFLLSAHYRNPLQYIDSNLKNARNSIERLYIALRNVNLTAQPQGGEYFISKFISKMDDDFNTPQACSILFEIAHELNILKMKHNPISSGIAATLKFLANILGILYQDPELYLQHLLLENNQINFCSKNIQELISIREKARLNNQWELADSIRNKLIAMDIILEDESTGRTKWRYHIS